MVVDIYLDWGKMMSELKTHSGSLKDVEWREFFISDIFTKIQRGKRLTKGNQQAGEMPYVSSTASNNGVDNFIGNSSGVRIFENCLTLANSGSVGSTFFHHYQFVASDHVTALQMEQSNKYVYLFLSTLIKRLEEKYSFNREINDKRIQREKILLPVNSEGKPDWQFMEDFIKQKEQKQRKQLRDYYADKTLNLMLSGSLKDRKWANFDIKDIFHTYEGQKGLQTYTGAYVSKQLLSDGVMPRITVKDTLNGIDSFCYSKDKNFRFFKNFISISFLGSVFHHPYEASLDMKVHALIPLEIELNPYIAKFLISVIKNSIVFLSYGNQLSSTDLPKVKILLPISSEGKPDWQFMENFMRQIEQNKIQTLLKYYNSLNYMENCGGGG